MVLRTSFSSISFSSHTISLLCVIIVLTFWSPRVNTFSTMSCSIGSTSPSSVPSCIIERISSSVTFVSWLCSRNALEMTWVVLDSTQTKGEAITEMNFIGPDTNFATFSEALMPIFFGTSSPKIKVRNVTMTTIIPFAKESAAPSDIPAFSKTSANSAAILLPEKIPVRIPMRVMPICTADRNLSGSDASFRARFAFLLPLSASVCRLDFLAEIRAISDMAKKPFSRIRRRIIKISSIFISLIRL